MATLQDLINAIPNVQDGDVITSNSQTTIKSALAAIASQLGTGPSAQAVTITVNPTFSGSSGNSTAQNWLISFGVAGDVGTSGTNGWIPLNLPDGALIQQLVVRGSTSAAPTALVLLVRVPLGASTPSLNLIVNDISNSGTAFTKTASPNVGDLNAQGLTASALIVQNSLYKYAIQALVTAATLGQTWPAGSIRINDLQVVYSKSQ